MGTNTATTYTYTYDQNGNITKIVDNAGKITLYSYDDLGQLIREDNPYKNASYTYTYDNNGNRTSKKTYSYTTGTLETATATQSYTYGDTTWGDRLTAFNGTAITYDAIGNPLSYNNGTAYTFTWKDGRRLATATKGGVSYSFTYNDEGIRTSKTVGGVKHNYTLEGTRIVSEQWSNKLIIYLYDELGSPMGMLYRTNSYAEDTYDIFYFEKNLQGDIIAIYNASGTKLVGYTYDAWGNCTTTYYNGGSSSAAQYNPFRYRGYYFDFDLGLYYLNNRYYDPNTGRFLNADGHISANGDMIGHNMYAYCSNNPIMLTDQMGESWFGDLWNNFINWLGDVFGASASVTNTVKYELSASHPLSPITYSSGFSETIVEQSYGDSSKPVSVYANGELANDWLTSSIGLKINIDKFTLKVPIALNDIGIYGSWDDGNTVTEYGLSVNISKLNIEATRNVTQNSTTQFNKAGISGWFAFVLVYVFQTGDVSQLQTSYAK